MHTKAVTKMTAKFYEPWNQVMYVTMFAKQPTKQQAYFKTIGINPSDQSKLLFYTKRMIDSKMFDKRDIIKWEDRTKVNKTWSLATYYFQNCFASKEKYASMVGVTAKKVRFESVVYHTSATKTRYAATIEYASTSIVLPRRQRQTLNAYRR